MVSWSEWGEFRTRNAHVGSADLQPHHFFGEGIDELSMAQVSTLHDMQRRFCLKLEDRRVELARQQEREAVEVRLSLELERRVAAL